MLNNRNILNETKRELKKLTNKIKRDKAILISSETIFFASGLSTSIKADRQKAKDIKDNLKVKPIWPFPNKIL